MDISRAIIYSLDAMTTWIIGGVLVAIGMVLVYLLCVIVSCVLDVFKGGQ
jgi:hypothetical protein